MGRAVTLQVADSLNRIDVVALSQSSVFLWLGDETWDLYQLRTAITEMAANDVLNIEVAGERSDESFSALLDVLSALPLNKHIMTGVASDSSIRDPVADSALIRDALEAFLYRGWPDEERWDEWAAYSIVVLDRPPLGMVIHDLALEIVGEPADDTQFRNQKEQQR